MKGRRINQLIGSLDLLRENNTHIFVTMIDSILGLWSIYAPISLSNNWTMNLELLSSSIWSKFPLWVDSLSSYKRFYVLMPQSTVQLKSPLLHTLLENLTQSSICTSTAIWHVPNPVNFICQYNDNSFDNKNNLFTDISINNHNCFNKNLQKYEEKQQITMIMNNRYNVTFLKLNNAANRVAMNLANYLERKWSSITNKINRTQLNQHSSSIDQPIEFRNQSDTVIALFMPPGIDRIVVQIACMKLHLAYMPLDRNVPAGRISQILNKLKPILILIAKDYYDFIYDDKINKNYHNNITSSIDNNNNKNQYY
ncbi:unnamed protein product [Schistosoma mattheei]|uniref:Uncharacterized protein n=1 Tax=Schistosoma mattheei TaxID=31246 RepID=A0AA85B9F5_9TREM|nr:unnamed protein product [Schistosoma mattheei]